MEGLLIFMNVKKHIYQKDKIIFMSNSLVIKYIHNGNTLYISQVLLL